MTSPAASASKDEWLMQRLVASAGTPFEPAADMADLAEVIRSLLAVQTYRDTRVRLGGGLFDVVITNSGTQARTVVALMDEIQDGCGPMNTRPTVQRLLGIALRRQPDEFFCACFGRYAAVGRAVRTSSETSLCPSKVASALVETAFQARRLKDRSR